MNWFQKMILPKGAEIIQRGAHHGPVTSGELLSSDVPGSLASTFNVAGANRPAENSVTAFACIIARREAIGSAPLMLTDCEENVIEAGPLAELLKKPNQEEDWGQFVRKLETHKTLHDVRAIWIGKESEGVPLELIVLHPEGLRPEVGVHAPTGVPRIIKWLYSDPFTGYAREFEPAEVIINVGFNPHAALSTLSPSAVLRRTIMCDVASREQNLALFQNGGKPDGYLHTDQSSTKDQMKEVQTAWKDTYTGYKNAHKTAITWGGVKYDRLTLTPAELEFLESLKAMRIDYYMAFRVYPAMLAEMTGETGLSQGSSTESQRVAWWEDVGIPELDMISCMLQQVADRFGNLARGIRTGRKLTRLERLARANRAMTNGNCNVWFNYAAIPALNRNRISRIDSHVKLSTTLGYEPDISNEYLDLGLPPHPDNKGRVPFNLQVIGEDPAPTATPGVANSAGTSPVAKASDGADGSAEVMDPAEMGRALDNLEEILTRSGSVSNWHKFLAPREKVARAKWSRFFVEQRGRVMANLEQNMTRADVLARADAKSMAEKVFVRDAEDSFLLARLTPLWTEHLKDGFERMNEQAGINNPFTIDDPSVMKAVEGRKIQGLKVNDTTEEALRNIFKAGFEAGSSLSEISDQIAGYYKDNCVGENSVRSMTAARTQTAGIVNEGQLLAAKEVGGLRKYWIHGTPEEPRETHVEAARTYDSSNAIGLEEMFIVGGEKMDGPGDSGADISNVANCTCSLGFVKG